MFLISTIVKCDLLRIVITLHHANLFSKRSRSWCHPFLIGGKSLFHVVICSFRVSSCDKKNLNEFSPEAQGYKTHNSFHNTVESC